MKESNKCVRVDNTVTTFIVKVRTQSAGIGVESIKDLIERKFEVVQIEQAEKRHIGEWTSIKT